MEVPARQRRKRGSISAEEIIEAAMTILDAQGAAALTFAQLGAALGTNRRLSPLLEPG